MNIIKYCPYFTNLKETDKDAYNLLHGFLRQNSPPGTAFIILCWIQKYWNVMTIIKILKKKSYYHPNINETELQSNALILQNCQYKFIIKIDSLCINIYPFSGSYTINETVNTIKDKQGCQWIASTKKFKIELDCFKPNSFDSLDCKIKSENGVMKILLNAWYYRQTSSFKIVVWEGNQFIYSLTD